MAILTNNLNSIGGVMVIVLASSAVDNSIGGVMVIVLTSIAVDNSYCARLECSR